ncbi:hypothetical protein S245_039848, partial [Arachis hypogaea]
NAPDAAVIAKCQMPKLFNTLTAEGNTTGFGHTICSPRNHCIHRAITPLSTRWKT